MADRSDVTRLVVVCGPESCGKTTLAQQLASWLDCPWTPEAARLFAEHSALPLSANTVAPIAHLGISLVERAQAASPQWIVRDQDLVSTVIYARHYYGSVEPWIEEAARTRLADLYLLCRPDVPWIPDGIRDRPAQRDQLFAEFASQLGSWGARVAEISGTGGARLERAREAVLALDPTAAPR